MTEPSASAAISVAIVEDREELREGMRLLIDATTGFDCQQVFECAEDALEALPESSIQVILMDIGLPGMSGVEATKIIKATNPHIQVIMLTVYEDAGRIFESLAAGATGYIVKKTPPAELIAAIKLVYAGGSPMSGSVARRIVEHFQQPKNDPQIESLSQREKEILDLLVAGLRFREIAERLFIGLETVRTHVRHIYEKLQVNSRAEATFKVVGGRRLD